MDIVETSPGIYRATIEGARWDNITEASRFWPIVQEAIANGEPVSQPELPPVDPKMVGVEFEGVMCSATAEDQHGLAAVLLAIQLQGELFQPTRFYFQNGSTLVITLQNWQAFASVWLPFRQSFFAVG